MYLSRIALDVDRRETLHALSSPPTMHSAIERSFPGKRNRNLWRIDWAKSNPYLLVLSPDLPDFTVLVERFGIENANPQWDTKPYAPLLARLKNGQNWQFRLQANPTRSAMKEQNQDTGRGKVFAHVTQDQQKSWLLDRSETRGFALNQEQFQVVGAKWHKFSHDRRGKGVVTLRTVVFEGMLTVKDSDLFKNTLVSGIGRGKAYGCGLLTIARRTTSHNE